MPKGILKQQTDFSQSIDSNRSIRLPSPEGTPKEGTPKEVEAEAPADEPLEITQPTRSHMPRSGMTTARSTKRTGVKDWEAQKVLQSRSTVPPAHALRQIILRGERKRLVKHRLPSERVSDSDYDSDSDDSEPNHRTPRQKYLLRGVSRSVIRQLRSLQQTDPDRVLCITDAISRRPRPLTFGQSELRDFDEVLFTPPFESIWVLTTSWLGCSTRDPSPVTACSQLTLPKLKRNPRRELWRETRRRKKLKRWLERIRVRNKGRACVSELAQLFERKEEHRRRRSGHAILTNESEGETIGSEGETISSEGETIGSEIDKNEASAPESSASVSSKARVAALPTESSPSQAESGSSPEESSSPAATESSSPNMGLARMKTTIPR
ncbi:MAG: hypothetical protein KVP17_003304 [Porospora cf. gigantea B]|uniref:uncharacterized protein n=1 Tax=Porospora cf. gigantea B TaxID=2853592 RepID=UPI003571896A|nr:MAG: hypothetical protein KVP17_003304 [Porospora cf. gigantea B]